MTWDLGPQALQPLIDLVAGLGATVKRSEAPHPTGRFVGTLQGREITLYADAGAGGVFKSYFTVAHLYGHMVQFGHGWPLSLRADALVASGGRMPSEDIQLVFDHEYEAAAIGRRLIQELGPVSREVDAQYTRIFFADFHYLIHFLETGQGGPEVFEDFLRRQPQQPTLIAPDPRPPVDLRPLAGKEMPVVIV